MSKVPVPAQLEPFVEALGVDLTLEFLSTFGGAELYVPRRPSPDSRIARCVGLDAAQRLAAVADRLPGRIPLQKPWRAKVLKSKGLPHAEIARSLQVSDKTVREWFNGKARQNPDYSQPDLFDD